MPPLSLHSLCLQNKSLQNQPPLHSEFVLGAGEGWAANTAINEEDTIFKDDEAEAIV